MNLGVSNFQRYKHEFACPVTKVSSSIWYNFQGSVILFHFLYFCICLLCIICVKSIINLLQYSTI